MNYDFNPIVMPPGTYWIKAHIIGPENCFWMVRSQPLIWGSECWLDYQDLGGLRPGSNEFGTPADLAFQLTGIDTQPIPVSNWAIILGVLLIT